jgi:glutamate-1-semialdehyde 2,1-aminomutase
MSPAADPYRASRELAERAERAIGGARHLSGRALVEEQPPLYFTRGRGPRVIDADGRSYIDWILSYGAVFLGHADPRVDEAAIDQARRGALLPLNHALHVEFAEGILARFPRFERAMFLKTGSEATTAALRIARRATGRRKVARCGYHGWHDWCLPLEPFVPEGLAEQVLEFRAGAPSSLAALFEAHPGEIAAVVLAPEMLLPPSREGYRALIEIAHRHGAVFVLDEVKTGVRIAPGSIHQRYDLAPDIVTLSKALGNGWPIAVVLGSQAVMDHARGLHCSATYHGETTGMAAALATLARSTELGAAEHVERIGDALIAGLAELAREAELPFVAYGEPLGAMPFFRSSGDRSDERVALDAAFAREMAIRGILIHPRHLWFVSASHGEPELAQTLEAARASLRVIRRRDGSILERVAGSAIT